ncbi:MAG: T9SS type A sorting domain-containing protein [Candidatus Marinimicrobia bacterium]|nr:T9SS type A sorting domain-containing protein [Candidatus Neomarinimicrobiota bacterium]
MKKTLLIIICNLYLVLANVTHTVNFVQSDLRISKEGDYDRLSYSESMNFDKEGSPELPGISVNLIIPSGQSVSSIQINSNEKNKIDDTFDIYPTQLPIPTSLMSEKLEWIEQDPNIYLSSEIYPKNIVKVISEGYFDGSTRIVNLLISPIQYSPITGEVWFSEKITFTLNLTNSKSSAIQPNKRNQKNQRIYDNILNKLVDNKNDISKYQIRHNKGKTLDKINSVQTGSCPSWEYTVITSTDLRPYFEDLVSWKIRKGIDAGIVTVWDICDNYTDGDIVSGIDDVAGSIRQYLIDAYSNGTVWVLIGGDDTVVPVRYGASNNNTYNWDYIIPTDLYYAELNGDWNDDNDTYTDPDIYDDYVLPPILNNNPRYGEPTDDSPEFQPELFVGRVAVSTQAEIENWFEKLLLYCDNPNEGSYSYLSKALLIQEDQMQWQTWYPGSQSQSDALKDYYLDGFYTSTILEEDLGPCADPTYPTGSDVVDVIDEGWGFMCISNHGAPHCVTVSTGSDATHCYTWSPWLSLHDYYATNGSQSGINHFSETKKYYSIYTVACDVAAFDYFRCKRQEWGTIDGMIKTFMEAFIESENKGAVAFGGNTRYGWVSPSFSLEKYFFDYLFDGGTYLGEPYYKYGVAEAASKAAYSDTYLRYSHNYFGDPEMDVWICTPTEYSSVSVTDNTSSITVNAGVTGSNICVCSAEDGEDYYYLASNVSSYTFNTSVRPLYITVTKPGYIPYSAVIGGTFTSDETWFGNIHVLQTTANFINDATLTILPGTNVMLDGYFNLSFLDNARLIAEGTEDSPIVFTSATGTSSKSWKYLYIRTNNNVLRYCGVEYGDYGIFMNGYPSTGNVIEYCDIHDNDQGIRMENNDVDITDCDIYNNRHNIVTTSNTEINIEGTHIHDGERDGIYCSSADLINLYGCVIEDNGNGGTSTRNGIYSGYTDLINLGNSNYPSWHGYNTVRDNYSSEIYCYGTDYIYLYYNSIHDDSGYEVYNSGSSVNILAPMCWWGESPPNYSQFYGSISVPIYLEGQPAWEGTTQSGGLSKSVNQFSTNNESPQEKITRLKNTINSNSRSNAADTALAELFSILRSDYKKNQYSEKDNFYAFCADVFADAEDCPAGKRALHFMIVWKMLENNRQAAIDLSQIALCIIDGPDRAGVMGNLVYLYAKDNQFDKATECLDEFKKQYAIHDSEIEFLTETIKVYKEVYEEEKLINVDSRPHDDEEQSSDEIKEFTLGPACPNPFNATTIIRYQLPKETHVKILVYNINGQLVQTLVDERQADGHYDIPWNASSYSSGVYLYRIIAGNFQKVRKMLLVK